MKKNNEKRVMRVKYNQKNINLNKSGESLPQNITKDSISKARNNEFMTHRPTTSNSGLAFGDLLRPMNDNNIEQRLEEFDEKHLNAVAHKIRRHIDIVSSIGNLLAHSLAKSNTEKELKAQKVHLQQDRSQQDIALKFLQKCKKADKLMKERQEDEYYNKLELEKEKLK